MYRRRHRHPGPAVVYDRAWIYGRQTSLERYRWIITAGWTTIGLIMRFGGDSFERTPLEGDILNHNLLLEAIR